jgi:hypothetical protein
MKKYLVTVMVFLATTAAFAQRKHTQTPTNNTQAQDTTSALTKALQNATPPPKPSNVKPGKKDWSKVKLDKRRPQDHFMFELGYNNWAGLQDSMSVRGVNRSANVYFMYNWPFKSDVRYSVAAGVGIGSDNIFFHDQEVLVAGSGAGAGVQENTTLAFPSEVGQNHFKKYKLVTTFLEFPVELRFALDPEHMDHTWKFAVGAKVGLMLSAYTKGKNWEDATDRPLINFTEKESSKQYFNTPEFTPTIRVNKGFIGVFGQIHAIPLIKASAGPAVFPWAAGVVISGL